MNNSELLRQATESLKEAVNLDKNGEYDVAYAKYRFAIEQFLVVIKFEKVPAVKETLTRKVESYMTRAEVLKEMLVRNKNQKGVIEETAGSKKTHKTEGAIVKLKPNVKWDDIAGLETAKETLKETVLLPVRQPQFFNERRTPWNGILLYGPPGTGKSFLAKAVATEVDSTFFAISSADIMSKYLGESEQLVRDLFTCAREESPAIVFVDEVDSLCSARSENDNNDALARVKTEFMVQMDGVATVSKGLLVLGATNLPWALDQAMRRRFQKRVYIALPNEAARKQIFIKNLGPDGKNFSSAQFVQLAKSSDGYSGSDLSGVVRDALMMPVRQISKAKFFKENKDGTFEPIFEYPPCPSCPMKLSDGETAKHPSCHSCGAVRTSLYDAPIGKVKEPTVSFVHLEQALAAMKPSVSPKELIRFVEWTEEFGQDG